MRNFLLAVAFVLGIYFVISNFSELKEIQRVLARADLGFLALALLLQVAQFLAVARGFQTVYQALGVDEKLGRLFLLWASALFVNSIAPSAGVGGMAMFIRDARRRGHSSAKVMVAGTLFLFYDYLAVLFFLALGILVLIRRGKLGMAEITATIILALLATGLGALVWLGLRSAASLERLLVRLAHGVNRLLMPILRRPYLSEQRAHDFVHDLGEGAQALRVSPNRLLPPAIYATASMALLVGIWLVVFLAFGEAVSPGTLISVFSISYLFLIVSPTPSGIGFVEGAATLLLRSFGFSLESAAILVLAYRAITYWIPLAVGGVAFRVVNHPSPSP
ncbi:MAG: lysylphosphatidylglycerol synthase transmembrane domain-containing protein [Chloroflexi bacterium]|nr:lysylphosphatidylglycerol synthase transmembrane domain-containing protein [Chloroflexota bacterium]